MRNVSNKRCRETPNCFSKIVPFVR